MTTDDLQGEIAKLYQLTSENSNRGAVWVEAIDAASDQAVLGVISMLSSTGTTGSRLEGFRESARASFDARLAARALDVEERLEAAATFLGKVGIVASIVIGIATIVVPLLMARGAS